MQHAREPPEAAEKYVDEEIGVASSAHENGDKGY
jgi:hypothetical protein